MWGATCPLCISYLPPRYFNPRAPCGARRQNSGIPCESGYFNPRAPCGARLFHPLARPVSLIFQSTRPVWGATIRSSARSKRSLFQSTRPVWGATGVTVTFDDNSEISIHAPRVGRDTGNSAASTLPAYFNPRAPCGARRRVRPVCARSHDRFQSTRPVWGATANLTILPRQICTKGTKEFLLGRKTHGKKEK